MSRDTDSHPVKTSRKNVILSTDTLYTFTICLKFAFYDNEKAVYKMKITNSEINYSHLKSKPNQAKMCQKKQQDTKAKAQFRRRTYTFRVPSLCNVHVFRLSSFEYSDEIKSTWMHAELQMIETFDVWIGPSKVFMYCWIVTTIANK